jgi:hypothetical protein
MPVAAPGGTPRAGAETRRQRGHPTTGFGRFITGLVLVGSTVGAGIGDGSPVPPNCTMATEGDCTLRATIEAANRIGADATITRPDANTVPNNPSSSHVYALLNSNGPFDLNDSGHTITISGAGGLNRFERIRGSGSDDAGPTPSPGRCGEAWRAALTG